MLGGRDTEQRKVGLFAKIREKTNKEDLILINTIRHDKFQTGEKICLNILHRLSTGLIISC